MSGPDRSWTIAWSLLSFGACLALGLWLVDGDPWKMREVLADRMTQKREADAVTPTAGPVFTAKPVVVADTKDDPPSVPVVVTGDRAVVGALEDVCLDGAPRASGQKTETCKRWGMDGFYRAVAQSKQGKLGRPVRVSWYGDSVIATDAIPAHLRTRMQEELGDGGPGFVYVVAPHRFCHHEGIDRTSSNDWRTYAISTVPVGDKLYGVGGSTTESAGGRATLKLIDGSTASQAELYYLAQPRGGTVTVTAGDTEVLAADTKAEAKQAGYATGAIAAGTKKLVVEARGKVRLFGIDLYNPTGATVDNLGIVSVNVKSFGNHDYGFFGPQVAHRKADLVMIMIGANEAAWLHPGDRDTKDYQGKYEQVLAPIRKARPDGSCLVVSPTDQAEAKDGGYPSRSVMPVLVEAQRRAARAQGCAFFSTYDWMGGKGSAVKWFRTGLVGSDFQHLSKKGADKLANGVFDALMAGYKQYAP